MKEHKSISYLIWDLQDLTFSPRGFCMSQISAVSREVNNAVCPQIAILSNLSYKNTSIVFSGRISICAPCKEVKYLQTLQNLVILQQAEYIFKSFISCMHMYMCVMDMSLWKIGKNLCVYVTIYIDAQIHAKDFGQWNAFLSSSWWLLFLGLIVMC